VREQLPTTAAIGDVLCVALWSKKETGDRSQETGERRRSADPSSALIKEIGEKEIEDGEQRTRNGK